MAPRLSHPEIDWIIPTTAAEAAWFARARAQLEAAHRERPTTRRRVNWIKEAREQLALFEEQARVLLDPPRGDRAVRQRETRRRARIELLPQYVQRCLEQIELARAALTAHPEAGKAVYHALMVGMLSTYQHAALVRAYHVDKRDGAKTTNSNPRKPPQKKLPRL